MEALDLYHQTILGHTVLVDSLKVSIPQECAESVWVQVMTFKQRQVISWVITPNTFSVDQ